MLIKSKMEGGRILYSTKPLLITDATKGYTRPQPGKEWFQTTTTIWRCDELIRRKTRDWRRLTGETGHTGERAETMRADHESVYTGTHSVFAAPVVEWILLRYGGEPGGVVLDAFSGGPPRAVVSTIMGFKYVGFDVRRAQIEENERKIAALGLRGAIFKHGDGRFLEGAEGPFDVALTCPPYHDLEKYSDQPDDMSNMRSYAEFRAGIMFCARAHRKLMKPKSFVCIIVGPFRDKKTSELIDLPAHTVEEFQDAGFYYHQQIVLSKNFGSAAKRSTNAWKGHKLVPIHEFLLVFRTP